MLAFLSAFLGCKSDQIKNEKDIFPPEKFSVIKAQLHGKLVVGSFNQSYSTYDKKNVYPWRLIISMALSLDSLDSNALPSPGESKIAYAEEDELVAKIQKTATAHYVGHLLNDGFMDIYLYLADPKAVNILLQGEVNKPDLKRGFKFEISQDPEWTTIKGFMQK